MKIDLSCSKNEMVMWAVCEAIGETHELINKMETCQGDNGKTLHNIIFSVGGVELDFAKLIDAIISNVDNLVEKKANEIINSQFVSLIDEIDDLQERVKSKQEEFKYSWE